MKRADGVGFEPTVGCPTPVFKTGAFDHSATHPDLFNNLFHVSANLRAIFLRAILAEVSLMVSVPEEHLKRSRTDISGTCVLDAVIQPREARIYQSFSHNETDILPQNHFW